MENYMDFFERVKTLVYKKNLLLKDFIESCGLNYNSYNTCKRYGNLPRADEAAIIALNLGTTVEYLVNGVAPDNAVQDSDKAKIREVIKVLENIAL